MAKGRKPETSNKPVFNAYTVQDRGEGRDPFWLKIGAAFEHKDGKGLNLGSVPGLVGIERGVISGLT